MKRIALILFAILILVVGGALFAPGFIDWSKYKEPIVTQINNATGYNVKIGGSLELAIIPSPRLMIEDVSVSSPVAQGAGPFVSFKRIDVSIALKPLLRKEIEVTRVRLIEPVVNLLIAKDGTASWQRPAGEKSSSEESAGNGMMESVSLQEIEIDKGSLTFQDDTKGKSYVFDHIEFNIRAESLFGPFILDGSTSYQGQQIGIEAKSERIAKGSKSFPVLVSMDIPSSFSKISYSGVVDFENGLELQGETSLNTQNLANLMNLSGAPVSAFLARPFSVQGLFTASQDSFSCKNLKISFADMTASGSILMGNLATKTKPVDLDIKLTSPSVDLDTVFPQQQEGSRKANNAFIPETITLPRGIKGKADIRVDNVRYQGTDFKNMTLSGDVLDKKVKLDIDSDIVAQGHTNIASVIDFSSSSISQGTGAVTYSDPVISSKISLKTKDAWALTGLSGQQKKLAAYKNVFENKQTELTGNLSVSPKQVKVSEGVVRLGEDRLAFGVTYNKGKGETKDMLAFKGTGENIDMDAWLKALNANKGDTKQKTSVGDMLQNFDFPFDLSVDLAFSKLRVQEKYLEKLAAKFQKSGRKLTVESLGLQDDMGNSLKASGSINDMIGLNGIDVLVAGNTKNAEPVLNFFKIDTSELPKIGSAEVLSEFKGHADNLAFTANVKALSGSLDASGILKELLATPSIGDLTLRARHPNYVQLVNLFNPEFKSAVALSKNIDFFTSVKEDQGNYKFSEIKAMIGPMALAGTLTADITKTRPVIKGKLQFGDVPISDFLGHEAKAKSSIKGQSIDRGQGVKWSRKAINTRFMHLFDADIQATAKSANFGNWTATGLAFDAALEAGILTLRKMDGSLYGGRMSMNGGIISPENEREPLSIKGKVDIRDVNLESFVQSFSGKKLINAKGTVFLDSEVEMAGISPAALIFDMHGKGGADGVNLVMQGFDLARLSRTLAQPSSSMSENLGSLLNSTMSSGSTKFDTMHTLYTIKNGVITFDEMKFNGPDAIVTGAGNINLPIWSVNLETEVKLTEPEDAPTLKTVFKGPLDNPAGTFGKSALDSWFQTQFGNMLEQQIINKLQDSGIIKAAPVDKSANEAKPLGTGSEPTGGTSETQPETQSPQQQQAPKEVKPEEMFFNILQDVLQ